MPPLTRWYVRAALGWLILALLAGLAVAGREPLGLPPAAAGLGPGAVHGFVVGWITQMIFGVAYWMFPRHSPQFPRGPVAPALAAFLLLNVGLVLRAGAEPWNALHPGGPAGALLVVSAAAQLLAGLLFCGHIWPRVKER